MQLREERIVALTAKLSALDDANLALAEWVLAELPASEMLKKLRVKTLEGVEKLGEDRKTVHTTEADFSRAELFGALRTIARSRSLTFPEPGVLPGLGPKGEAP